MRKAWYFHQEDIVFLLQEQAVGKRRQGQTLCRPALQLKMPLNGLSTTVF